ncbi:neurogenic locus notch homolog protein 2-like isoform X2 [Mya arenaria]|uniref:neurogenic locus notch homolog protein 2-like isoform X2 n=1 Tax=Mya arenaria TaxID=6604 RepID=UPI0022E36CC1|nr:neurogenic locus notch homolog protein 2-like isoform X2 [Mya arenaria]
MDQSRSLFKGSVFSACPPGLCSLDETSFFRNEYCDIKADTECDINVNCNGDGKCYFDQYTKNTTCICSEKRIGDMCQYNYTTFGMPCSSNLDCHSGVCIVAGPGDNRTNHCDCPLGLKGARCEQIDRQYLSESWECENEARAYIQGQYLGCSCKCGTVGQFCEEMDERAPYHYSCDNQLCKRGECVRFIGGWPKFFSYGCKCPNGFVGTFCQYPNTTGMPPRKPSRSQCPSMGKYPVCENGGSCYVNNKDGKYVCECPCGFHGDFCQFSVYITSDTYKHPCETTDQVCQNGGECYYNATECRVMCKCWGRFIGDRCNRDCGPYRGCANKNCGRWFDCVEDECGNPKCVKNENYGKDLDKRLNIFQALGIAFAVIVIASLLTVFVCYMNNKRRRKHRERIAQNICSEQQRVLHLTMQRMNQHINNNYVQISDNAIYTVTGGGNATRINGAHNGYQPETRSTPTHTSDAQARQTIEQLNANNNVNTSQNSTHTESNNDPPSYEEVCQPPPTYSDVLRSMP